MVIGAGDEYEGENQGMPINPAAWGEAAQHAAEEGMATAQGHAEVLAAGAHEALDTATDRLALGDEERLPWLESADDVDFDEPAADNSRMVGFGVLAVLLLAALLGGIYWISHRGAGNAAADGSLIAANKEPYKIAPKDPGGKTFEGTGDASFKVSEGEKPVANLAGSAATAPTPAAAPKPSAAAPAPVSGGVGVQVGAFSTNASAEAAWSKLVAAHNALSGLSHRVVEGKADMATVFRLQAIAGDAATANALCAKLQAGGLKCQVKR
ncbi:SPOR domain-containing protein [Novosphingobium sp.]|uniref:SPOR domain-containing protein n=1 Tax=Novosphingobium sp. TaxID=1874826 RepID=UPI0026366FC4|nr:SPOR domain-containing protein [Novosphingobium sp.]